MKKQAKDPVREDRIHNEAIADANGPEEQVMRSALVARLDRTRAGGHNLGYGVGDDMDSLLAKYVSA